MDISSAGASTVPPDFSLNQGSQLTGTHIQPIGNFPKSFKIGLLVPVLNHRQMRAGNAREPAQDILG